METSALSAATSHQLEFENATKRHSAKKIVSVAAGIALPLLLIGPLLAFHAYLAWHLTKPHIAPLTSNPEQAVHLPYEDVTFARGAETLHGWYIPAGNARRTVIFSHGYGGNREEVWVPLYDLARSLHERRFNVLMFDYGYVSNPRLAVTGGIREALELQEAIRFSKDRGADNVYIWGFSMGAGTALQAALGNQDINGMILDSTFVLTPDSLFANVKQAVNLPRYPSLALIQLFSMLFNGYSLSQIPFEQIVTTDFSIPLFLIHGEKDERASYTVAESIFANQKQNAQSELWLLPNGQHELLYNLAKREYVKRALTFLQGIAG